MQRYKKFLTPIILLISLILVFWFVAPPKTWAQASLLNWIVFYMPLFLLFSSLSNLYFKFPFKSAVLALGMTLLIIFQGLKILNLASLSLTIIGVILIIRSFKKPGQSPRLRGIQRLSKLKRQ